MVIDWMLLWGASKVVGALVKPVLEGVAKDLSKDKTKAWLHRVAKHIPHDEFLKVYGKAIKELVEVIDEELCNSGVPEHQTAAWAKDVQQFIFTEIVRESLPQIFTTSTGKLDGIVLQRGWKHLPEPVILPDDFSWNYVAETFNRKLRKLRTEDADFQAALQSKAAVETAENTKNIAGLQPKSDLNAYREALLERYANLHFDTLDTTGAFETKRQLWNIFVAQTVRDCQEYRPQDMEIPKEHQRRLREQGEWQESELHEEIQALRRRNYSEQVPRSVLEAVNDDRLQRLVILGDPGSGKSSLLHYLALEWARIPDAAAREAAPLPLLIELREYNNWDCPSGKSFVRYLHDAQNWYRLDQLQIDQRLSNQSGAILLLDGLDEIFDPARRELAVNDITRFSNEYPNIKILVTSRVIGYKQQRLGDAEFRHLMLQDLEEPQITDFLERWHNETFDPNRADREAKKARLAKAINDSHAIRELAGNPLLLTMMAILNRHQELPRDRARLYEQASRVLLHEWDTERTLESHPQLKGIIGHQEKIEMLRDIAYFMQSNATGQVGNIIARGDLERLVREYLQKTLGLAQPHALAKALVEQLRERNFILCFLGADSYAFVHRTFLEYFCALAIVREFRKNLSLDYLKDEVFGKHWHDETWHEVLCLIAGLVAESSVEQVAELIDFLLQQKDKDFKFHHIFLAAQCYQEVRKPKTIEHSRRGLFVKLTDLLQFDLPYFYEEIDFEETQKRDIIRTKAVVAMLNALYPEERSDWLKQCAAQDKNEFVRGAAVRELAHRFKDDSETLNWLKQHAAQDKHEVVRQVAVRELARGFKDDPKTLNWLKQQAAEDKNEAVRYTAVRELARGYKGDPETLNWLKQQAAEDKNEAVRRAAAEELARGYKDDPEVLTILKQYATQDANEFVRYTAVRGLARGYKDDPETVTILKQRAGQDDDVDVRLAAVEELARGYKDDPEVLTILKQYATQDANEFVRYAVVRELARGYKGDPEALNWLKQRARQDENEAVRQVAVRELARGYKYDPETLTILKQCAAQDGSESVRHVAVEELARSYKIEPETLDWLKQRARQDKNWAVRHAAVRELTRGFKDDPETMTILKQCAAQDENKFVRRAAVGELVRGYKDDPEVLTILKQYATQDANEFVRYAAVRGLARGYKDDPETVTILKQRAGHDDDVNVRYAAVEELARGYKDDLEVQQIIQEFELAEPSDDVNDNAFDEDDKNYD